MPLLLFGMRRRKQSSATNFFHRLDWIGYLLCWDYNVSARRLLGRQSICLGQRADTGPASDWTSDCCGCRPLREYYGEDSFSGLVTFH
jgi:hypothetical protein